MLVSLGIGFEVLEERDTAKKDKVKTPWCDLESELSIRTCDVFLSLKINVF